MRLRIHRGTREIGGTCIELESERARILLDLGLPLNASDLASTPLPNVDGLSTVSASLLGIVLSHGHRDHWGLVPKVNPAIPLIMGKATDASRMHPLIQNPAIFQKLNAALAEHWRHKPITFETAQIKNVPTNLDEDFGF